MKKLFSFFVALLATTTVWAYDFLSGDLYYNILSDSTVEVTMGDMGYNTNITSANIPETVTYNGTTYRVIIIGEWAFNECSSLTSITIPNGVKWIESDTFRKCSSLTSITIPNSVRWIKSRAFNDCSSLISITIPNSVREIGKDVFRGCMFTNQNFINNSSLDALASNYWGAKIVDKEINGLLISNNAIIDSRHHIITTTVPDFVTSIGHHAFNKCSSLTSITIPNSVTSIGHHAFNKCSSLTSITIPNSVTSIGEWTFNECSSLTSITIPNSVTSIGEWAFNECSSLTSITIPNSVTSIGHHAFNKCSSLTSISIPNNITKIGYATFENCGSLTSVTIPNSVTSIGDEAFKDCSSLTSVTIPHSVTSIGDEAFKDCSSLTSVTIPNSVMSIGDKAFSACLSLTSVIWNAISCKGFKRFDYAPFYDIRSQITSFTFGDDVVSIPASLCFEMNNLQSVDILNSVTSIGDYAFFGCSLLTSITIPSSVTSIGKEAFSCCFSLTSINIPNSVTSIGEWAFYGCPGLTSITPSNSTTSIGSHALVNTVTKFEQMMQLAEKDKLAAYAIYDKPTKYGSDCLIQLYSLDDSDNYDRIMLHFAPQLANKKDLRVQELPSNLSGQVKVSLKLDTLKKVTDYEDDGTQRRISREVYYAVGPAIKNFFIKDIDTHELVLHSDDFIFEMMTDNEEVSISENFYNDLKDTFGEQVEYLHVENVRKVIPHDDDFSYYY